MIKMMSRLLNRHRATEGGEDFFHCVLALNGRQAGTAPARSPPRLRRYPTNCSHHPPPRHRLRASAYEPPQPPAIGIRGATPAPASACDSPGERSCSQPRSPANRRHLAAPASAGSSPPAASACVQLGLPSNQIRHLPLALRIWLRLAQPPPFASSLCRRPLPPPTIEGGETMLAPASTCDREGRRPFGPPLIHLASVFDSPDSPHRPALMYFIWVHCTREDGGHGALSLECQSMRRIQIKNS